MEFLMRDDVNLSAEQWQSIDSAVIQAARNVLVGRKFLQIYGPLGAGAQSVNVDVLTPAEKGSVDFFGEEEEAVKVTGRSFKELPMIYRDFVLWNRPDRSVCRSIWVRSALPQMPALRKKT